MSDTEPGKTPDRDVLAAEYLLGLLEPAAMAEIEAAAARDPALARLIGAWGDRLDPLASLAPPVAPSDVLWARIERDLPGFAQPAPRALTAHAGAWRLAAVVGFATSACLAAALLLSGHHLDIRVAWDRPPQPDVSVPSAGAPVPPRQPDLAASQAKPAPPYPAAVALLNASGRDQPAMKAVITKPGLIRLTSLQVIAVPAGKELVFWVWPRDVAAPIRVGKVGVYGGSLPFPYAAQDGTPVMVTEETASLPATEERGPTLFQGTLGTLN